MSDFDGVFHREGLAAVWARIADEGVAHVAKDVDGEIAVKIDVDEMRLRLIGADDKVRHLFDRRIGDDLHLFFESDGTGKTDGRAGDAFNRLLIGEFNFLGSEEAAKFIFVDVAIAANKDGDGGSVDIVDQRLDDLLGFRLQERADLFDRVRAGGGQFRDVFEDDVGGKRIFFFANFRLFNVGGVTAFRAVNDVVFAVRGGDHEFVGRVAADRARLGFHGKVGHAATFENLAIRVVHFLVRLVERL